MKENYQSSNMPKALRHPNAFPLLDLTQVLFLYGASSDFPIRGRQFLLLQFPVLLSITAHQLDHIQYVHIEQ